MLVMGNHRANLCERITSIYFYKLMFFLFYFSLINRKRESGLSYLVVYVMYLTVATFLFCITQNYIAIIIIDFIIKLGFSNHFFSNYKYVIYLPLSLKPKKNILFLKPLISFLNFPILLFLFNYSCENLFFVLFIVINSYFPILAKININRVLPFLVFYLVLILLYDFKSCLMACFYCFLVMWIIKKWTYNLLILKDD